MSFCKKCEDNVKKCSKCRDGYYFQRDLSTCDNCQGVGIYLDGNKVCRNCSENCDKCSNETACEICADRYFLNQEKICAKCEGLSYVWNQNEGNSKFFVLLLFINYNFRVLCDL